MSNDMLSEVNRKTDTQHCAIRSEEVTPPTSPSMPMHSSSRHAEHEYLVSHLNNNNGPSAAVHRRSISPASSSSPSTMSPSPEHTNNMPTVGFHAATKELYIQQHQQQHPPSVAQLQHHYVAASNNSIGMFTSTSPPPKKSFCIDSLLSKNKSSSSEPSSGGDRSPVANRYMSVDSDGMHGYNEHIRDFTPSPDEGISR